MKLLCLDELKGNLELAKETAIPTQRYIIWTFISFPQQVYPAMEADGLALGLVALLAWHSEFLVNR